MRRVIAVSAVLWALLPGCGDETTKPQQCETDEDCGDNSFCIESICVSGFYDDDGGDARGDLDGSRDGRTDGEDAPGDMTPDLTSQLDAPEDAQSPDRPQRDRSGPDGEADLPSGDLAELLDAPQGEDISWADDIVQEDLPPDATDLGPDLWVELIEGPSPSFMGRETNVPLPDRATVDITIPVTRDLIISDMQVYLRLDHPRPQDLLITLISPEGTEVILTSNTDMASPLVFDDQPLIQEDYNVYPSLEPLGRFHGESAQGEWILKVEDRQQDNTGILSQVWLEIGRPVLAHEDMLFLWEASATANRFWVGFDEEPDPLAFPLVDQHASWGGDRRTGFHYLALQGGDGLALSSIDTWTFRITLLAGQGEDGGADRRDAGQDIDDASLDMAPDRIQRDIITPDIPPDQGRPDRPQRDILTPDISPDLEPCWEPTVQIVEGPSRVYANMVQLAIPDGDPRGVTSAIFVNEVETITEVQVMVRIEHIDVEDLVVTLTNPDGDTTVTLHDRTTNEYGAVSSIYSWYDDEGLRAKPAEPLSSFDGQDIMGRWTLTIVDDTAGSEPCDCDVNPWNCDPGCNCDPDCGHNGWLIQWEIEFGPSTPHQLGGEYNDPMFTWEGLCADRYWYDSDAMPDTGDQGSFYTTDWWLGNHALNALHTFFVIGGDGTTMSIPASRTFQFTDVW